MKLNSLDFWGNTALACFVAESNIFAIAAIIAINEVVDNNLTSWVSTVAALLETRVSAYSDSRISALAALFFISDCASNRRDHASANDLLIEAAPAILEPGTSSRINSSLTRTLGGIHGWECKTERG